ncbi:hypothetical protein GCM10007359_11400 [Rothia aerolata]|uniref:Uncharacterized protein n=2 Tax=Rothia aerolata TaxID=1812262 RepID=A0A917IR11_9MICC|nr:hypothetical protein GCM10007359_11400 [Rothia aerolata]
MGAGLAVICGCWMVATLNRWLAREWIAQRSVRAWIGGSYLRQLVGFALGPAVATCLYSLAMAFVFAIPLHITALAFLMGLSVSLGDSEPQSGIEYDLTITTAEGIVIPLQYVTLVVSLTVVLGVHVVALLLPPVVGVLLALGFLVFILFSHWRASR